MSCQNEVCYFHPGISYKGRHSFLCPLLFVFCGVLGMGGRFSHEWLPFPSNALCGLGRSVVDRQSHRHFHSSPQGVYGQSASQHCHNRLGSGRGFMTLSFMKKGWLVDSSSGIQSLEPWGIVCQQWNKETDNLGNLKSQQGVWESRSFKELWVCHNCQFRGRVQGFWTRTVRPQGIVD